MLPIHISLHTHRKKLPRLKYLGIPDVNGRHRIRVSDPKGSKIRHRHILFASSLPDDANSRPAVQRAGPAPTCTSQYHHSGGRRRREDDATPAKEQGAQRLPARTSFERQYVQCHRGSFMAGEGSVAAHLSAEQLCNLKQRDQLIRVQVKNSDCPRRVAGRGVAKRADCKVVPPAPHRAITTSWTCLHVACLHVACVCVGRITRSRSSTAGTCLHEVAPA